MTRRRNRNAPRRPTVPWGQYLTLTPPMVVGNERIMASEVPPVEEPPAVSLQEANLSIRGERTERDDFVDVSLAEVKGTDWVTSSFLLPQMIQDPCDLIINNEPVPERFVSNKEPIITATALSLAVFENEERVVGVKKELLESVLLHKFKFALSTRASVPYEFEVLGTEKTRPTLATLVKEGLDASVFLKTDYNAYYRILYVNAGVHIQLVKECLAGDFPSLKGLRSLTEAELAECHYHVLDRTVQNAYELWFGSFEDGARLCETRSNATPYPVRMDIKTFPMRLGLIVRWSWQQLSGEGSVSVPPNEAKKAAAVLQKTALVQATFNREHVDGAVKFGFRFDPGRYSEDNVETFKTLFRTLFTVNQLSIRDIKFERLRLPFVSTETLFFKISQAICHSLIGLERWDYEKPRTKREWEEFLEQHKMPWMINTDGNNIDCKARVEFHDFETAEAVWNYMNGMSKITCEFSQSFYLPAELRTVFDEEIRKLDVEMRGESDPDGKWVRLRDCPNDLLTVEGYPKDHVEYKVILLKSIIFKKTLDCSDPEKAVLLHGCGAQLVNRLQKEKAGKIFISVDRLNQKIDMFGNFHFVDFAQWELMLFTREPHNYVVKARILIDAPNYLPIMKSVLDFSGEKELANMLGGCGIEFDYETMGLIFEGTVCHYNSLNRILGETQYNIIRRFAEPVLTSRAKEVFVVFAECAVCLNPYDHVDHFRLGCGHAYCLLCLCRMIHNDLKMNKLPLRCIYKGCLKPIPLKDILTLLFDEQSLSIRGYFTDRLDPLARVVTRWAAKKDHLVNCIQADCEGLWERPPAHEKPHLVTCPICANSQCSHCFQPPHEKEDARRRYDVVYSIEWYREHGRGRTVRRCGCGAMIDKNEGCNHVECSYCRIHSCWLCNFTANHAQAVYDHMREIHNDHPIVADDIF